MISNIHKHKRELYLAGTIILIISYFLPWFYSSKEQLEMFINGLGQGSMIFSYNNNKIIMHFSWDLGIINIAGLFLSFILLLLCLMEIINFNYPPLKNKNENIKVLLSIMITFLGVLYITLFFSGIGNITTKVLGLEISTPLSEYYEDNFAGSSIGIGYGFFLFIIATILLIIVSFLSVPRKKKYEILK